MKRIVIFILWFSAMAVCCKAQPFRIHSLRLDEGNRVLQLIGTGLLSEHPSVFVTDRSLPLLTASDSIFTYAIPDTGWGSAGNISVYYSNDSELSWSIDRYSCLIVMNTVIDQSLYNRLGPNIAQYPPRQLLKYYLRFRLLHRDTDETIGASSYTLSHATYAYWDDNISLGLSGGYVEEYNGSGFRFLEAPDSQAVVSVTRDSVIFNYPGLGGLGCSYSYYYDGRTRNVVASGNSTQHSARLRLSCIRDRNEVFVLAGSRDTAYPFEQGAFGSGSVTQTISWDSVRAEKPYAKPSLANVVTVQEPVTTVMPVSNPMGRDGVGIQIMHASQGQFALEVADVSGHLIYRDDLTLPLGNQLIRLPGTWRSGVYFFRAIIKNKYFKGNFCIW